MTVNLDINHFKYDKHGTSHWRPVRLVITLVALGALTYGICHMANVNWSHAGNFFKGKIAAWKIATIVGSITVTGVALAIIFHRATRGKDSAHEKLKELHGDAPGRGKLWGDRHWVPIKLGGQGISANNILDTSTLVDGTGVCFAYEDKPKGMGEMIAGITAIHGAPLYIPAVAIYQAVTWPLAAYKNGTNPVKELGKSVWRIIQSPFYGLAYFIAQLWVFVDPPNGRKIIAGIERDWNSGALVENSCWIANGYHSYGDGRGMDLGREGHSGFYIEGCFQPTAVLTFEKGVCTKAKSTNGFANLNVSRGWEDV